jgi:hypothetical protein|nr:hypothetical protein [Neorhizobium tomejilense]
MAIHAHLPLAVTSAAPDTSTSKNHGSIRCVTGNFSVAVKPLEWEDATCVVFEDEGPTTSEAIGAGYHYLAEAVDMTLSEAKAEGQERFEQTIRETVVGVRIPLLSDVEKALEAIISRVEGGTVVSGQNMEMTRQRVEFLEKDIRDYARSALDLIRSQTSITCGEGGTEKEQTP